MNQILRFLKSMLPASASPQARDEADLAESLDILDLKRRMRAIDERGRNRLGGITFGLYAC